jgi:hypothetical protein
LPKIKVPFWGRANRSFEQLHRLVGHPLGVIHEVELGDHLPTAAQHLAFGPKGIGADLEVVPVRGPGQVAGAGVDQLLIQLAAFGADEDLAAAVGEEAPLGQDDLIDLAQLVVDRQQDLELVLQGDRQRISLDRRAEEGPLRRLLHQLDGTFLEHGRSPGQVDGPFGGHRHVVPGRLGGPPQNPRPPGPALECQSRGFWVTLAWGQGSISGNDVFSLVIFVARVGVTCAEPDGLFDRVVGLFQRERMVEHQGSPG